MSSETDGDKVDAITEYWLKTFDEPDPGAKRLSLKLMTIGLAISRDSELWSKSFGLTRGEMAVLMALFRAGDTPTRPTDLLVLLSMSSAGMTKHIKKLEASGLVERGPNPNHKGGFLISLTGKGKELAVKARKSESWGPITDALTKMPVRMQKNAEEIFDVLVNAAHAGAVKRKSRAVSLSSVKPLRLLDQNDPKSLSRVKNKKHTG